LNAPDPALPIVPPATVPPPAVALPQPDRQPQAGQPTPPPPPQLIFGKYKTLDEAEKGYKELERTFHTVSQERAQLKKQLEPAQPTQPQPQAQGTPVADTTDYLDLIVNNKPGSFEEALVNRIAPVLERRITAKTEADRLALSWQQINPDLADKTHFINAEMHRLISQDQEFQQKAAEQRVEQSDVNRLLESATRNVRSFLNIATAQGKAEAATIIGETKTLGLSTVPQATATEVGAASQPAPPAEDPTDAYLKERRANVMKLSQGATSGVSRLYKPAGQ